MTEIEKEITALMNAVMVTVYDTAKLDKGNEEIMEVL